MVHIDHEPLAHSFGAQLDDLRRLIGVALHPASPESGFIAWAIARSGSSIELPVPPLDLDTLVDARWAEAPVLAAIGYRLNTGARAAAMERWLDGMYRVMARDPVPVDRNSFFFRPLELLGLAVGSQTLEPVNSSPLDWLRETINGHADRLPVTSLWSCGIASLAAQHVGANDLSTGPVNPTSPLDTALLLWLQLPERQDALASLPDTSACRQELLKVAAVSQPQLLGEAERAIFAIALHDAVLSAVGGIELHPSRGAQFIIGLCRRFPAFIRELGTRHNQRDPFEVNDEYDVQDLLRAVLRVHFSDVRPEEWNPSYGDTQSRSDFLLKPERVVIETKMTRPGLGQRQVVEQLAIDKAKYQGHPDCETLICFVYDPGLLLRNPVAIESDLSGRAGGLRTLVVVSPQGS